MIAALAVALKPIAHPAFGLQVSAQYARMFPHPSGQNAMEDCCRAGDMLTTNGFGAYQSWTPPERRDPDAAGGSTSRTADKAADVSAEERALREHLNHLNFLQVKQEEVARFPYVIELLDSGNMKPLSMGPGDPLDFRIYSYTKTLAKYAADAAYVSFAGGQADRATHILNETLVLSHRISGGDLLSNLVGTAICSIALSQFNGHTGALSLDDARQVSSTANAILNDRQVMDAMVQNERKSVMNALSLGFADLERGDPSRQSDAVYSQYQKMSPGQRAEWARRVMSAVDDQFEAARRRFEGPEDGWLDGTDKESDGSGDSGAAKSLADVERDYKTSAAMCNTHSMILTALRSRAQLRLLRLHGRIIEYQWLNGRLPKSLDDLKLPKDEVYDSLSRKPFHYVLTGPTYKLSSLGVPELGEVELKYVRPAGLPIRDADVP